MKYLFYLLFFSTLFAQEKFDLEEYKYFYFNKLSLAHYKKALTLNLDMYNYKAYIEYNAIKRKSYNLTIAGFALAAPTFIISTVSLILLQYTDYRNTTSNSASFSIEYLPVFVVGFGAISFVGLFIGFIGVMLRPSIPDIYDKNGKLLLFKF